MKKLLIGLSMSTLLLLAACGDEDTSANNTGNNNENENNNVEEVNNNDGDNSENEQENEENNNSNNNADDNNEGNENEAADEADDIADSSWDTEVGETVETDGGTFTLHARADDIDTIETGPIVMEIEQLNAQSGELSSDFAEMMDTEELHMIQMDLNVENTADEDIMFYSGQATISTSTGEQLESDMWLSDHIDGDMMSGTNASGTFFFVLENSDAADVESVRLTWNAPNNEDFESVGEDVDIEVEF